MAGSTTNLGLIKPLGSEKIRIAQLNQNSDTLDAAIGAVGSTSLQAQVSAVEDGLAIVANGDSHVAITAGQFVYVRNNTHNLAEGLYVASANVSANASITSSNMTADASGGLNALNSKFKTIESGSFNDISESGVYYLKNAVTDKPTNQHGMLVLSVLDSNTSMGLYLPSANTYAVYTCVKTGGTWAFFHN